MWLPDDPWRLSFADLVTCPGLRSAALLDQVIDQFDIPHARRYLPNPGTLCNIASWDVTRALGCEIPHWLYGKEQNVNATQAWLLSAEGQAAGFGEIIGPDAQTLAAAMTARGECVVVLYFNPDPTKHGHIASMRSNGNITQAGARNFSDEPISHGFGNLPVRFFHHK